MKKKLNSSSKRKWVLNGVLAFGAVALLTTGFATWVVGVNREAVDDSVNVAVDTTENNTVKLEMTLDTGTFAPAAELTSKPTSFTKEGNKLYLKEKDVKEGKYVSIKDNDTFKDNTSPLTLKTKELKITVGETFLAGNTITGIKYAIKYATDEVTKDVKQNAANKVNDCKIDTYVSEKRSTDAGYYTYLTAPVDSLFTLSSTEETAFSKAGSGSNITYTLKEQIEIPFTWGTFFGGQSPATFYNSKTVEDAENKADAYTGACIDELKAMKTALNSQTLVLSAKLITGPNA